jgi:hypothetical protein
MNLSATRLAVLSVLTLLRPCQDPATKKAFVIEAGEIKMTELIDKSAALLGWNILVSDQEIAAAGSSTTIRLQNRVATDLQGCEDFLTSMLYQSGFALTALDEQKLIYEVISIVGPRQREITNLALSRTPEQVLARPSLKVPVLTVVELKHINATIATNALRPFYASTGGAAGGAQLTLGNVGNNSAMLLCGYNDQVAAAIRLLKTCDVPPPPDTTPPALIERIDAVERRLQAIEQKVAPQQQQGR